MRGSIYSSEDIRRIIKAVATYCTDLGSGGELPPVLYRDLIIYALTFLQVKSTGPDNDRRYQIAHDWKRRLELNGINPDTFEIEDQKEFEAAVAIVDFTRKQREKRKDEKRKLHGPTRATTRREKEAAWSTYRSYRRPSLPTPRPSPGSRLPITSQPPVASPLPAIPGKQPPTR
jgi:hypothetical protein